MTWRWQTSLPFTNWTISEPWNRVGRACSGMRVKLRHTNSTAMCRVLHVAESGMVCANPQVRKASQCGSMFDQVISIRNPAFRSQNLDDNAADEKNSSPAQSPTCIYAFWEAVGGQIAALKSWNMPKAFVQQSCGLHRPCTQTDAVALSRQSACSRPAAPQHRMCWLNTVHRSAIWLDVGVFFLLLCWFGRGKGGLS